MEELRSMFSRVGKALEGDVKGLEAKIDRLIKLPERMEIEDLVKTMAWSMDSGDRELWLSVWSEDIEYFVPQYGIEIKGKKALKEFGDVSIFDREERRFSSLSNILIDVTGDTASGRDYYEHYGFQIDPETGNPSEERAFSEGQHFYEFRKVEGVWKISRMEVHLNRRQEAQA